MITFIEQRDVEEAVIRAMSAAGDEIARYLEDSTSLGNLIAGAIKTTQTAFLLELLRSDLISNAYYSKLRVAEKSVNK